MLHYSGKGNRYNSDDAAHEKSAVKIVENGKHTGFAAERQAKPRSIRDTAEIDFTHDCCQDIRDDYAKKNRDDLDNAPTPYTTDYHSYNGNDGKQPVARTVGDGRARERKTDGNDHRASHHRRKEREDSLRTEPFDQCRHDEVAQTCTAYTQASIAQGKSLAHAKLHAHLLDRQIATDEGKAGTKESWNNTFRNSVED